jgi:hypothetical protein
MQIERLRYHQQKAQAKGRGIEWKFTFNDWFDIWLASGKWEQRGCKRGQYVMSRYNDIGPYSKDNVFIQLCQLNVIEKQIGKQQSLETVEKRVSKLRGREHSAETRVKMSKARLGKTPWNKGLKLNRDMEI